MAPDLALMARDRVRLRAHGHGGDATLVELTRLEDPVP